MFGAESRQNSRRKRSITFRTTLLNFKINLVLAHQAVFAQAIVFVVAVGPMDWELHISHSIKERSLQQHQEIVSVTERMDGIELERSSQTLTVPIESGTDGLAAALECEVHRMASQEENAIFRSGFQRGMIQGIQQLLSEDRERNLHYILFPQLVDSSSNYRSQVAGLGFSGKKRRRDRTL